VDIDNISALSSFDVNTSLCLLIINVAHTSVAYSTVA